MTKRSRTKLSSRASEVQEGEMRGGWVPVMRGQEEADDRDEQNARDGH